MIGALATLLTCQLAGEVVARALHLPVPGPVIGMVLLFVALLLRGREAPPALDATADGLLGNLGLLFVPAGVGVVAYAATLRDDALPIVVALTVSWLAGLAVVGWTATLLLRRERPDPAPLEAP